MKWEEGGGGGGGGGGERDRKWEGRRAGGGRQVRGSAAKVPQVRVCRGRACLLRRRPWWLPLRPTSLTCQAWRELPELRHHPVKARRRGVSAVPLPLLARKVKDRRGGGRMGSDGSEGEKCRAGGRTEDSRMAGRDGEEQRRHRRRRRRRRKNPDRARSRERMTQRNEGRGGGGLTETKKGGGQTEWNTCGSTEVGEGWDLGGREGRTRGEDTANGRL